MRQGAVVLAVFSLAAAGCDFRRSASSPGPAAPSSPDAAAPQARLSVAIVPNPVVIARDPVHPTARTAVWTVHVSEVAGVGGRLTFLNASVRDADTGAPVEPGGFLSLDAAGVRALVGTDRLAPGGTFAVPQSLQYESAGSRAVLAVAVQVQDDRGNLVGGAANARLE